MHFSQFTLNVKLDQPEWIYKQNQSLQIYEMLIRDDPQNQIVCFLNIVQTAFVTLYTCTALQRVFEQC